MKNLFYDEVIYECDLGEMSLADFLPHWVEKESIFYWSTWKKGLDSGYYLNKKITKNHFLVIQRHGGKFTPNIEVEYKNRKIIIKFYPPLRHYVITLLPLLLLTLGVFYGLTPISIWIGLGLSLGFLFCIKLVLRGAKQTIKHDLELEFRYQKIKYDVKDGETYYPTS